MLVWETPGKPAHRLVRAFLEVEARNGLQLGAICSSCSTPPFTNAIQYSLRELKAALAGQYEASRDELRAPKARPPTGPSTLKPCRVAEGFVAALRSFGSEIRRAHRRWRSCCCPPAVGNGEAFAQWLKRAVDANCPGACARHAGCAGESRAGGARGPRRPAHRPPPLQLDGFDVARAFARGAHPGAGGSFPQPVERAWWRWLKGLRGAGQGQGPGCPRFRAAAQMEGSGGRHVRLLVAGSALKVTPRRGGWRSIRPPGRWPGKPWLPPTPRDTNLCCRPG